MQNGAGTEYKLVQLAQKGLPKCKFNTRSQYVSHSPGDVSEGHGASPGKFLVPYLIHFAGKQLLVAAEGSAREDSGAWDYQAWAVGPYSRTVRPKKGCETHGCCIPNP